LSFLIERKETMDNYKTTDIILAACMKLKGINLIDIEIHGNKGTFVFEHVDENLIAEYDLGNCLVEPITFNNTIKQLTTSVRRKF
jgi:hypothetical protein